MASPVIEQIDGMIVTKSLSDDQLQARLPFALGDLRRTLRRHRIARAWLFGSRSRGDHRPNSDVDLLYEPEGRELELLEYGALLNALDALTSLPVDAARNINPRAKKYVADDLVRIL